MPHLSVTTQGCQWRLEAGDCDSVETAVRRLPGGEPVVILIHGYRYRPGHATCDPHRLILSRNAVLSTGDLSWPHHLGIQSGAGALSIGLGWDAAGSFWRARNEAARAGLALAALIRRIRAVSPRRRVVALAHSLGARVVLSALPALAPGDLRRAVLMFPALLAGETRAACALRAADATEFVRVASRENLIFDVLAAGLAAGGWDGPISSRVTAALPAWTDLPIDCDRTLAHLARRGFAIAAPSRRVCHWSSYMRPGIFALYRALLTAPVPLPVSALRPPEKAADEGFWGPAADLAMY